MSASGPMTPKWGMTLTCPESTEAGKGISSAAFAEFDLGAPPRKSATSLRETFCTVLFQVVDSLRPWASSALSRTKNDSGLPQSPARGRAERGSHGRIR
jgi:hypothetical protein